jgi:uncharacterized membrane protein
MHASSLSPGRRTAHVGELVARVAPHLPVAALIAAYGVRFATLSVQVYDGYGSPGYDMGIFDQGVWLLSRFHTPFVTVMGRNLFGDHTSFVLLLAVPLYWILPEAQTLLVLQTCLIAAAAIPIYLLALKLTRSAVMATALAAAFLLNPALEHGNLEQFHPESFLVPGMALAIYAAVDWKPRLLALTTILCLLVKEDVALLMIPLGVWVALRRNRAWGLAIVTASAAYLVLATQVVIRLLLGTSDFYANRVPFGGFGGLLAEPFAHPIAFWKYVTGGSRPSYAWQMGASFGWVFLVFPEVALIGVLALSENVLSTFPYMHQILYHYSLAIVPVLAMGTVYAVAHLSTARRQWAATAVVTGAAVISCWLWGLAPFSREHTIQPLAPGDPATRAIDRLLTEVPRNAVVSAQYAFVAHLDHRTRIYQWPTPFRAKYWSMYRQEGQRLRFAGQVQYLVLPVPLAGGDKRVFASISARFHLVGDAGGVGVYERNGLGGRAPSGLP